MVKKKQAVIALILCSFCLFNNYVIAITLAVSDSWQTLMPLPTAKTRLMVTEVNDKVYSLGGYAQSSSSDVEEYDTLSNTWIAKAQMPNPESDAAVTTCDGKIYLMGGEGSSGSTSRNLMYDPLNNSWSDHARLLTPREGACASTVNGKIYLIGGFSFSEIAWPFLVNSTEIYDPVTDKWSTGAPLPDFSGVITQSRVSSTVLNGKIYVVANNETGDSVSVVHVYDPVKDTWSSIPNMPNKVYEAVAASTSGAYSAAKLYVISGSNGNWTATGLVQVYDPQSGTWSSDKMMLTPRIDFGVAVVKDKIYAIGGSANDDYGLALVMSAVNEVYTPDGYGQIQQTSSTSPPASVGNTLPISTPSSSVPEFSALALATVAVLLGVVAILTKEKKNKPSLN